MLTSVGFWVIETATTINQNATIMTMEDSNKINPVTHVTDVGEVNNLFGNKGSKAAESSTLHSPRKYQLFHGMSCN